MRFSILLFGVLAATAVAHGATVSSDPIGYFSFTAKANSDTLIALPLHRQPVYEGTVSSTTGNVITVTGSPNWTSNQFVYAAGTQTNTYYVLFGSGTKEGMYYTVTANAASTLTVDLAGDNLATVVAGEVVKVIPYWTFGTLFPNQTGIATTTSITGAGAGTLILVPDMDSAGINRASQYAYYYYSGASFGGPGWRRQGGGGTTIRNDDVLLPDSYIMFRNSTASDMKPAMSGSVQMTKFATPIGTVQSNTAQDNPVGLTVASPVTLDQSRLYESGAISGTTSITGAGAELLLVFDNNGTGFNPAASEAYYYYTGSSFGGPGWRKQGGGATNLFGSTQVFQPGRAYIIRKNAAATPATTVWTFTPPYLNQ